VANSGVITALDGAASQYVRGDGTLADFPTSSGGGSSVSYYLNSSVSQGTIGGVDYKELNKEPIIGAGTDIAISTTGYVASYLTDANDPDVLSIPGGNFNCEFYFSVNNNTGNPFFYAELYKYDGTTFTLLGSSVGVPEYINQGTIIAPYYFAIPVATSALALTDRLAIRIYVNVDGRTVTLHTENGHLCQVVTTLSKGMVSLNNLTDQSQFLAVGTSGTDFNIVSSGDTHTFNIPSASATNRGLVTIGSQSFEGIKTFNDAIKGEEGVLLKNGVISSSNGYTALNAFENTLIITSLISGTPYSNSLEFTPSTTNTYTFPNASGTIALTSNLSSYVPYTGATGDVNLGLFSIISNRVSAIGDNSTYGGTLSIKQNNVRSLLGTGYTELFGKTNILGISFGVGSIANLSNSVLTAERTYTLPDITGTLALLEGSQTFSGSKTFSALTAFTFTNGTRMDYGLYLSKGSIPSAFSSSTTNIYSDATTNNIVIRDNSSNAKLVFNNSTQTYTFPAATGTIALTSNLSSYVPYTGATGAVNLGAFGLSASSISLTDSVYLQNNKSIWGTDFAGTTQYNLLSLNISNKVGIDAAGLGVVFGGTIGNGTYTYTLPSATGTLALTSDLSAYLPLTGGTLTGALIGTSATFSGTVSSIVTSGGTSFRVVNSVNSRAWSLVPSTNGAESDLWLYYGGTGTGTKVSFVNNGNVLIGSTTDSGELLQVNGTSKFTGALSGTDISLQSSNFDIFKWQKTSGTASNIYSLSADSSGAYIQDVTNTKTLLYLAENTGAATFSSSVTATNLYLGSLTNEQLMISGTGSRGIGISTITSGDPFVRLYDNTTIKADIWWGRSGNYMGINSVGGNTAINPFGGNVLIGTTTDAGQKLQVSGMTNSGISYRAGTYTQGDTTPSVSGVSYLGISNSSPTTITNFTNGIQYQIITLYFSDSNTTINRSNCYLSGGVNFTSTASDILTLINIGGLWYEVSRSVNS
jgi:hypothetical protein